MEPRRGNPLKPLARREGLVVEELPEEVLVYDLDCNEAHCLNPTAASIWKLCDGQTAVRRMAGLLQKRLQTPVDDDLVWLALEQLDARHLLAERLARPVRTGVSRRKLMRDGLAAVVALPVIASIVAPTAAAAASPTCSDGIKNGTETDVDCGGGVCPPCANGKSCLTNADCASGLCSGGVCVQQAIGPPYP